jgi:methylated-DNA-[protein]-cysteine S-methyltransferase
MARCSIRYTVFPTQWGYFAFAAGPGGLLRTCLPLPDRDGAEAAVTADFSAASPDGRLLRPLQDGIRGYFAGRAVDFDPEIPLDVTALSAFAGSVLSACRRVGYGRTIGYGQLAAACGRPAAARAVAGALAANPFPIVVGCHRVIRRDGRPGGFSGRGGTAMKRRLLELERAGLGTPAP